VAEKYALSHNPDVHTRCLQLLALSQDMEVMQAVLPVDASCEEIEVDPELSFLDDFVEADLQSNPNARRYIAPQVRMWKMTLNFMGTLIHSFY
jgi:AP-4 complex subunit epsilon-1